MAFVSADAYARFMGRYSVPLAQEFAELAGVDTGQRVLDVGCGPGALTAELVRRLGAHAVVAIDPSEPFVAALRVRFPEVDARVGVAEHLPFPNCSFEATLAQLVVHFMTEPVEGLREMVRVTTPGGVVAACVWDHASGEGPLSLFWRAAHELDPDAPSEAGLAGAREGHLAQLCEHAGLNQIESSRLAVHSTFETFSEWWDPFTFGVGPAGDYVSSRTEAERDLLRTQCEQLLPRAPFEITAAAWCVRGRA